MDRKKLVLLLGALIVAIGTALLARSLFAEAAAPRAEAAQLAPKGPKVLVAQRALPIGTILSADAVAFQPWPKELVRDAYYIQGEADVANLLGTVVRFAVTAGEPITQGSLVAPGDRGFLAAALGPGMRAVTVPVSARTGVAGFVFPGDRVDLVLTQTVAGESSQPLHASETIVRNVRVLAIDQSTASEVAEGKTVVREVRTVTLEATPKIAEKIAVAQTIGTLSLSLRSIADSAAEIDRAIASGDIAIPPGASREHEEQLLRAALNRPLDTGTSFVTGGDVSRFQRRTMPPTAPPPSARQSANVAVAPPREPASTTTTVVVPQGPTVRVTRGKSTETVVVEGN